ncbi:MAG: hypothetical protein HRU19_22425 [Pseudobacteriovorax sp.]|nr:hypothetical protein [Pseudobacteriovorax sp.]
MKLISIVLAMFIILQLTACGTDSEDFALNRSEEISAVPTEDIKDSDATVKKLEDIHCTTVLNEDGTEESYQEPPAVGLVESDGTTIEDKAQLSLQDDEMDEDTIYVGSNLCEYS